VNLALDGINSCLPRLTLCPNLTGLSIFTYSNFFVDISKFGLYFPRLKTLRLEYSSFIEGVLRDFEGLEELCIRPIGRTARRPLDLVDDFRATLRSLQNEMYLEPLQGSLLWDGGSVGFENQWDLLSGPRFAALRKIDLRILRVYHDERNESSFYPSKYYVDMCMLVVERMTVEMVHLEMVQFWGALDLNRVHVVDRWRHLKGLWWVVPAQGDYIEGRRLDDDLTAIVRKKFYRFTNEPVVLIEELEWDLDCGIPVTP
jgi:hypothetical protein